MRFPATSTNRAPRQWEAGREGEKKKLKFELKLIADIGLVGFLELVRVDIYSCGIGSDFHCSLAEPVNSVNHLHGSHSFLFGSECRKQTEAHAGRYE